MIDFEAVKKLRVQVSDSTEQADMERLAECIQLMNNARAVIVRGPIQHLDAARMNKLGWYRA